jgi:hypothetical protein
VTAPLKLALKPPRLAPATIGGAARIDRAFVVALGAVTAPDGGALPPGAGAGAFVYRSGADGERLWDPQARRWVDVPGDDALGVAVAALPLAAGANADEPWSASVDPAGALDADGAPVFAIAPGDAGPRYFVRARVTATIGGAAAVGLSAPSAPLAFVRVAPLVLPPPALAWPGGGARAPIEQPVEMSLAALVLPGGGVPAADAVRSIGVFVHRADGAWWNGSEQRWTPPPAGVDALAEHQPLAMSNQPGQTPAWTGTLAAAGQQDADGAPRFAAVQDGGIGYRLRLYARVEHEGVVFAGQSAPAPDLLFARSVGNERFAITFDTDSAADATEATLRLADAGGVRTAFLRLRAGARDLELASCDAAGAVRARIRLTGAGDIELTPAPGRRVLLQADVECERVRYRPAGGGPKQDLA